MTGDMEKTDLLVLKKQLFEFYKTNKRYFEVTSKNHYTRMLDLACLKVILRELKKSKEGLFILDVGCGTGRLTFDLAEKSPKGQVVGMDISEIAIRSASHITNKLDGRINLIVGDAESLPLREEIFDFIVLSEVIEHLVFPQKALEDVFRVLKHHGRSILFTPNKGSAEELYERLEGLFLTGKKRRLFRYRRRLAPLHVRLFNTWDLLYIIKSVGFKVEQNFSICVLPSTLLKLLPNMLTDLIFSLDFLLTKCWPLKFIGSVMVLVIKKG